MNEIEEITNKIKKVLLEYYPDLDDYYFVSSVWEMVEYCEKANKAKGVTLWLSFRELTRVNDWNNIRDQIKYDILEKGHDYTYRTDKSKNDYERGVLAAIRLIEHRVHCICD